MNYLSSKYLKMKRYFLLSRWKYTEEAKIDSRKSAVMTHWRLFFLRFKCNIFLMALSVMTIQSMITVISEENHVFRESGLFFLRKVCIFTKRYDIIKILDSNGHLPFFFQSNKIYGLILSAAIFPELNTFLKSHFFSKANFLNNNNRKEA